ncbi:MAG: amine oxidase [Puniceicoccaceae bacterium]|nr:amine oxidase [Puniceicoccaceae bacterium]
MGGNPLSIFKKMSVAPLKIAVIGSGVAGLTAAHYLNKKHSVHLIEKSERIGGHTRTLNLSEGKDAGLAVDTGFIVMNLRNYPHFNRLLKELKVGIQKSCMTFSYTDTASGYGYAGTGLHGMLPQLSYLFNLSHYALIGDLIRFAFIGYKDLKSGFLKNLSLGDYLDERKFCPAFQNRYLFPMGAAIWSSPMLKMREFPAEPYLHFLDNHGLLRMINPPQWYTIKGGSQRYVQAILNRLKEAPRICTEIDSIRRPEGSAAEIQFVSGAVESFDHIVIATHADTALSLLGDANESERGRLSPWTYQENEVILHSDTDFMPTKKSHWASWNFMRRQGDGRSAASAPVSVSYYMNRLQKLKTKTPYLVTLNPQKKINPDALINRTRMTHPLYSFAALESQKQLQSENGKRNTWFCGSYFGYGFHEDAVRSSVELVQALDPTIPIAP